MSSGSYRSPHTLPALTPRVNHTAASGSGDQARERHARRVGAPYHALTELAILARQLRAHAHVRQPAPELRNAARAARLALRAAGTLAHTGLTRSSMRQHNKHTGDDHRTRNQAQQANALRHEISTATAVTTRAKPAYSHSPGGSARSALQSTWSGSNHSSHWSPVPTSLIMSIKSTGQCTKVVRDATSVACTSAWGRAPTGRSSATPCATRHRSRARRPAWLPPRAPWPPPRAPEAAAAALAATAAPSPRRPCTPAIDSSASRRHGVTTSPQAQAAGMASPNVICTLATTQSLQMTTHMQGTAAQDKVHT